MTYDIDEHRHRFAAWCAARAAQRGLAGAKNETIVRLLDDSKIARALAAAPDSWPADSASFDVTHRQWCTELIERGRALGVDLTFGRAAKIAAIYLKTLIVVGGHHECRLACVAHPPIDSILLKSLSKTPAERTTRQYLSSIRWTQLDASAYDELIGVLRELANDEPLWALEAHWNPG